MFLGSWEAEVFSLVYEEEQFTFFSMASAKYLTCPDICENWAEDTVHPVWLGCLRATQMHDLTASLDLCAGLARTSQNSPQ